MLLLLLLIPLAVWGRSYEEFIARCVEKNFDGRCDLSCYNFTGRLNDFELFDCKDTSMRRYLINWNVTEYPPKLLGYLEGYERQVRELLSTRVELETTEQEIEDIVSDYISSPHDHAAKKKWEIRLKFSVWLQECESCPQGEDYIQTTLYQIMNDARVQTYEESQPWSPLTIVLIGLGISSMMILAIFGVTQVSQKRKRIDELPFYNTRKRMRVQQTNVWMPPSENSQYSTVDEPKRRKPLRVLHSNILLPVYNHLGVPKDMEAQMKTTQLYSIPTRLPPPPQISIPPVREGTLDKDASYQPVQLIKTHLHGLVLTVIPGYKTKETEEIVCRKIDRLRAEGIPLDIDAQDNIDASTALLLAVKNGRRIVAKKLLELGANVHLMTVSNSTVLHHAVHNEDPAMLKVLLEYRERFSERLDGRPAIDALNNQEKTPLMLCASSVGQAVRMAKLLVEAGADIADSGDPHFLPAKPLERTVLHHAVMENNVPLVEYLIAEANEQRKDILDLMDHEYHTALWHACKNVNVAIVRLLMDAGANQFIPDTEKKDQPITIAELMENREVLDLLTAAKSKSQPTVRRTKRRKNGSGGYSSMSDSDRRSSGEFKREVEDEPTDSIDYQPEDSTETNIFFSATSTETFWQQGIYYPSHTLV